MIYRCSIAEECPHHESPMPLERVRRVEICTAAARDAVSCLSLRHGGDYAARCVAMQSDRG
jgi:hypothetical protein